MIKAVAFDMDGLMFDNEALMMRGWNIVGKQCGYDISPELYKKTIGLNSEITKQIFQEELGLDFDYEAIRALRVKWVADFIAKHGMPIKDGLIPLLDFLKKNHYKMTIATSSARSRTLSNLELSHLSSYFDEFACNDMVTQGKPAPDIYLKAAEIMGVEPQECIALEDSPMGILSAYTAGLKPVMIPDLVLPDENTSKMLYAQLPSLTDVIPFLQAEQEKAK